MLSLHGCAPVTVAYLYTIALPKDNKNVILDSKKKTNNSLQLIHTHLHQIYDFLKISILWIKNRPFFFHSRQSVNEQNFQSCLLNLVQIHMIDGIRPEVTALQIHSPVGFRNLFLYHWWFLSDPGEVSVIVLDQLLSGIMISCFAWPFGTMEENAACICLPVCVTACLELTDCLVGIRNIVIIKW